MSVLESTSEYSPPANRRTRTAPQLVQTETPREALSRNARSVLAGIDEVMEKRDIAERENTDLKARLEQHQIKVNEQASQIERLTIELNAERSERIRLGSVIEQTAHGLSRAIEQPEPEQD